MSQPTSGGEGKATEYGRTPVYGQPSSPVVVAQFVFNRDRPLPPSPELVNGTPDPR
jgi:hypothetical protein